MPTCREIVKEALVWRGVTDPAEEPDDAEAKAAMRALIALYRQDVAAKVKRKPVAISADYEAGENEEVSILSGSPTVTLPTSIDLETPEILDDGTQVSVRKPRDRAVVVVTGASPAVHLYDAARDAWVDILTLTLTSEAPLATHYYDGLAARLAVTLRYPGYPIDPVAAERAQQFVSDMTGRWDVERDPAEIEFF